MLTQKYKQTARQQRIQSTETTYAKGMSYTNKPLAEGYSKAIVNFSINDDGTLSTRPGYKASRFFKTINAKDITNKALAFEHSWKDYSEYAGYTNIVDAKKTSIITSTGHKQDYLQVLTFNKHSKAFLILTVKLDDDITESKVYDMIATQDPVLLNPRFRYSSPDMRVAAFTNGGLGLESDKYEIATQYRVGNLLSQKENVQGLTNDRLTDYYDSSYAVAKPPGTFAYGDMYFTFMRDTETNQTELHYSKWETETGQPEAIETHPYAVKQNAYVSHKVEPRFLNPAEAQRWGVNMLLDNPYDFQTEVGAGASILGLLAYREDGETIELNPGVNQGLILKAFYRAPTSGNKTHRVRWEYKEISEAEWKPIKENDIDDTPELVNFATLNKEPMQRLWHPDVEEVMVRVLITDPDDVIQNPNNLDENLESVVATASYGFSFTPAALQGAKGIEAVNYDLGTAKGMIEWKGRLVLWGVEEGETVLFTSETNQPNYFPYPGNIDIFEEPILHVTPYGDDLVVFTATKIYRVVLSADGLYFNKTVIQRNLNISELDVLFIKAIKNMIFFKSGNQFYMLVPKSLGGVAGETSLAPVSKPIATLLDNLPEELYNIVNNVTADHFAVEDTEGTPAVQREVTFVRQLADIQTYVDGDKVVVNYIFDISPDKFNNTGGTPQYNIQQMSFLNVKLIYNTASPYSWSMEIHETHNKPFPVVLDTLKQTVFLTITPYILSQGTDRDNTFVLQMLEKRIDNTIWRKRLTNEGTEENPIWVATGASPLRTQNCVDYVARGLRHYNTFLGTPEKNFDVAIISANDEDNPLIVRNYTYLDTGYRDINSTMKKRFREMQFNINNTSQAKLEFYNAFLIDGNSRKEIQGYQTTMLYDPNNPNVAQLLVERPYVDEVIAPLVVSHAPVVALEKDIPGITILDDSYEAFSNAWELNNSSFPELSLWKIRINVAGKGFVPRMRLLSTTEMLYNILNNTWVYRTMNSR